MAQLYANENFPRPVVEELRRLGHEILTSQQARNAGRSVPDSAVLAFATAAGRVVLTLNRRHFVKLHNQTTDHAGIVVCSYDANFAALAARVNAALNSLPNLR